MSNVVNLNRFRKSRARADRAAQADANAVKFGRSKTEKAREQDEKSRADKHLDDHKRDEDPL